MAQQKETGKQSLSWLLLSPFTTGLTVLTIGIALTLPTSLYSLVQNLQTAIDSIESTNRISLFIKPELSDKTGQAVFEKLKNNPGIAEIELITKEAGFAELKSHSGFGEALASLEINPIPVVLSISPKDSSNPANFESLLRELSKLPEADFAQVDFEWILKVKAMIAIVNRLIFVFCLLLAIGVIVIVGNTIRLELQNRHEEIAVAKLMGATDSFISRPFFYTGVWYGLLAGTLAWCLSNLLLLYARNPVLTLAELYHSDFDLSLLGFSETFFLIGFSIFLGITGSLVVVHNHLNKLVPG